MVEPCRWRMIDGWMYTLCWLIVAGRCIGVEGRRLYGLYMVLFLALLYGGVWFAIGVLFFCLVQVPRLVLVLVLLSCFYSIVQLKCTLWNVIRFYMIMDTFAERVAICSWLYMRKELLAHQPSFFMMVMSTPLRYMAMSPPARRLCEPTRFGNSP